VSFRGLRIGWLGDWGGTIPFEDGIILHNTIQCLSGIVCGALGTNDHPTGSKGSGIANCVVVGTITYNHQQTQQPTKEEE
jgi:hypothetical protein